MQFRLPDSLNSTALLSIPTVSSMIFNPNTGNYAAYIQMIRVQTEQHQICSNVILLGQIRVSHLGLSVSVYGGYNISVSDHHQQFGVAHMNILYGLICYPNIAH